MIGVPFRKENNDSTSFLLTLGSVFAYPMYCVSNEGTTLQVTVTTNGAQEVLWTAHLHMRMKINES